MAHVGLVLGAGGLVGHAYHAGVLRSPQPTTAGTPGRPPSWSGRRPAAVSVPCCAPAPGTDLAARVLGDR